MGFEQLASLKDELAKRATAEKEVQNQKRESENIKKPNSKVPLKIGIHKDLLEHAKALGLTPTEIRAALKKWVKGKRYSECMVASAARIDLQGQKVGFVSNDELCKLNDAT